MLVITSLPMRPPCQHLKHIHWRVDKTKCGGSRPNDCPYGNPAPENTVPGDCSANICAAHAAGRQPILGDSDIGNAACWPRVCLWMRARSTNALKKSDGFTLLPPMWSQRKSGNSSTIFYSDGTSLVRDITMRRAKISTSKSQRVRNGVAKTARMAGLLRNSFAPHCVS